MILAAEEGVLYPRAFNTETILAYLTYLVTPADKYCMQSTYDGKLVELRGRGLSFPSVHQAIWAIAQTHLKLNLPDPTKVHCIQS